MSTKLFGMQWAGDVLVLTLDTPGCDFNIFSHEAAVQLLELLEGVDRERVRALVFRSAKPGSFVNGVGLMMAGTAQAPEDIPRMTETVTRAYRAVREFPAPTIAAIRGNCYGCGVEFSLHCDYRVAAHTYETHFYMTEIAEYLFIPAFGSTQDLPQLIGLESATDALLWGQRWSAPEAMRRGLVDACFDDADFDGSVTRFVDALLECGAPKRWQVDAPARTPAPADFEAHTRARISNLPQSYQPVYTECFDLMLHASRRARADAADYQREVEACGRAVVNPIAKAALSIFFVRRLAQHHSLREHELPPLTHWVIDTEDARLAAFAEELRTRRVRGLSVEVAPRTPPPGAPAMHVARHAPEHGPLPEGTVSLAVDLVEGALLGASDLVLYAPLLEAGLPVVEVRAGKDQPLETARGVFALLHRAGFHPVLSHATGEPVLHALLGAYLGPLVAHVLGGGEAREALATVRTIGFVRSPAELIRTLPRTALAMALAPHLPGPVELGAVERALEELATAEAQGAHGSAPLADAVFISLLGFVTRALAERTLGHPTVVDVLARELIDFPLGFGSLCRYLTRERASRLLTSDVVRALLPRGPMLALEAFVSTGRDFYPQAKPAARPAAPAVALAATRQATPSAQPVSEPQASEAPSSPRALHV
ncbi:enoyl-CoA hydratase/isomerase family protein [Pyxidicoccus sp. MSG2]|uniref:enoyl-CoA hydratase/isomerase family protein n=1 Tax=Pyxidicoccus sp. MSG2 TaxID=2996790 RepID=UPI002270FF65|nr:enoyl-CoA hydratase/isomerase family protein [Pyxidicoccus sp. MSG2]MCY1016601.1 enoyl-CoA hydratase/isomerase family protein [Pyxidicoccus sp. MSG2]